MFCGQLVTSCTKRCCVGVSIVLMGAIKPRCVLSARPGAVCALSWLLLNGSTASHVAMGSSVLQSCRLCVGRQLGDGKLWQGSGVLWSHRSINTVGSFQHRLPGSALVGLLPKASASITTSTLQLAPRPQTSRAHPSGGLFRRCTCNEDKPSANLVIAVVASGASRKPA